MIELWLYEFVPLYPNYEINSCSRLSSAHDGVFYTNGKVLCKHIIVPPAWEYQAT